jgi:hypothetical protein
LVGESPVKAARLTMFAAGDYGKRLENIGARLAFAGRQSRATKLIRSE